MTYERFPDLTPSDRLLRDELSRRGAEVEPTVWSDRGIDWGRFDLCVLRSAWDYDLHLPEYLAWVERVGLETVLLNDPDLIPWNLDKRYLRELAARGVPIVETEFVYGGDDEPVELEPIVVRHGWEETVVKPVVGHSARNVASTRAATDPDAQAHLEALARTGGAMVQPLVASVREEGELSFVFADGECTHVVRKTPAAGEFRVQGGSRELVVASVSDHEQAAAVLEALDRDLLYARVDMVRAPDSRLRLMELEIVDPALYLEGAPHAVSAFAQAILRRAYHAGAGAKRLT